MNIAKLSNADKINKKWRMCLAHPPLLFKTIL
jgi:hypothetical protein